MYNDRSASLVSQSITTPDDSANVHSVILRNACSLGLGAMDRFSCCYSLPSRHNVEIMKPKRTMMIFALIQTNCLGLFSMFPTWFWGLVASKSEQKGDCVFMDLMYLFTEVWGQITENNHSTAGSHRRSSEIQLRNNNDDMCTTGFPHHTCDCMLNTGPRRASNHSI